MKRKFKIVGTVVSLGLCLAMLVIGVYAATSVSFDISASIRFVVTDVFADIEGKVYLDAVASKGTTQVGSTWTSTSYSGNSPLAQLTNKTWDIGTTTFTSEKDCIVYTLKITNSANSGSVNVSVSTLPVAIDGTSLDCKYAIDGGASAQLSQDEIPVNAGEELLITITRTLTNKTKAIDSTLSWSPTVTIENVDNDRFMPNPVIEIYNRSNTQTWTIVGKETAALSSMPTASDYTINAKSNAQLTQSDLPVSDTKEVKFNGVTLDATNKYYGFQLQITPGTSSTVAIDIESDKANGGEGYNIHWTFSGEFPGGYTTIYNGNTLTMTCVVELTDIYGNVDIIPEHLFLSISLGNMPSSAEN